MDILECGKVLNTHGVRGELKVDNYCDEGFFKKIKNITIGGVEYHIKAARDHGAFVLLTLDGIETVEQAMLLKGKPFKVTNTDALTACRNEFVVGVQLGVEVVRYNVGITCTETILYDKSTCCTCNLWSCL